MNFVEMFEQFSIKRKRLTESDYKRGYHSGLYSIEVRMLIINIDSVFIIKGYVDSLSLWGFQAIDGWLRQRQEKQSSTLWTRSFDCFKYLCNTFP